MSGYVIDNLLRKINFRKIQEFGLITVVIFYIASIPLLHLKNSGNYIDKLKGIYVTGKMITEYHDFNNVNIVSQTEDWSEDLALSYYLNARYYGKVKEGISDSELEKKINSFDIKYYFVHGTLRNTLDNLKFDKKFGEISIYKIVQR